MNLFRQVMLSAMVVALLLSLFPFVVGLKVAEAAWLCCNIGRGCFGSVWGKA